MSRGLSRTYSSGVARCGSSCGIRSHVHKPRRAELNNSREAWTFRIFRCSSWSSALQHGWVGCCWGTGTIAISMLLIFPPFLRDFLKLIVFDFSFSVALVGSIWPSDGYGTLTTYRHGMPGRLRLGFISSLFSLASSDCLSATSP